MEVAVAVASACLLTVASSSVWGADKDPTFRPVFQPRDVAFGIWGAIFFASLAYAVALGVRGTSSAPSAWLYAAALAVTSLWPPLQHRKLVASSVIGVSFALASASLFLAPRSSDPLDVALVDTPVGLLAGWLCVAFALSVVLVAGEDSRLNHRATFWAPAVAWSAACFATGKYAGVAPVVWAAVLTPSS